ncbi:MAG: carboxypeptidase-like regulatory domain-containing protein [Candidatus Marinimicrobia bacterium]|nr:carboxypeptidase-like regulatory domain-containing protein [Candidatus Neomarinimicrobiota bacterium]
MRNVVKNVLVFSIVFVMFTFFANAGTTGKITGTVIDGQSGAPLVGCNIVLEGTYQGAASDMNGNYMILNVSPGTYRLKAQMIGYQTKVVEGVEVSIDLTTTINFEMGTEVLTGDEVVVTAQRKMVVMDMTATSSHVKAEELENLPITEVSDALQMQAGYVDGSLRGGRKGEVAYLIDGIPVTDSYDRSAVVDVNKNMVQELQVISGAFNAEYGKVMSGIVNITTKQGSNTFGASIESYFGDYLSNHDNIFDHISAFNPVNIRNIEGSIFGPIVKDKLFFYLNGRDIYFGGWQQGQRRYKPTAVSYIDANDNVVLYDSTSMLGDNKWVNMNWNRKLYFQGQLIYRMTNVSKIFYSLFYDNKDYQDYDRMYKYNPDGMVQKNLTGLTHILKYQRQLNTRTFFTIAGSFYERKYTGRLSPDKSYSDSTTYVHPYYLQSYPYQFHIGGTDNNHEYRDSRTTLMKFDLTSQINSSHQIKIGGEYRYHDLSLENFEVRPASGENYVDFESGIDIPTSFNPYIHPTIYADSTIYHSSYHHNPNEFAFFIQDKMEFKELIVNVGVRFDYFEPDGVILADPSDPEIYDPIKPENRYHDTNGNGVQDIGESDVTLAERKSYWYKDASAKYKISPRIGFSFPISDRGVFHFSYGHFFQIPNFTYLYQNPEFELGSGTGNQGVIGNADLKPEQTIVGEIGVQQQLTQNLSLDVTAYVKDVRDLTGTRADEIEVFGGSASYSKLVNSDFGVVKGITIALNQQNPNGFYTSVDYTLQIARGTASDPEAYRNAISGGSEPEIQLNPLDWDQRHTINATVGYNTKVYGINFIGRYGSGLPYTPRLTEDITSLLTNAGVKPATFSIDTRGYYRTKFAGLSGEIYLRILNLLDNLNEVNVYNDTGRAGFTTDEERVEMLNIDTPVNSVHEYYTNSTHYSEPRRIEIGLRISL